MHRKVQFVDVQARGTSRSSTLIPPALALIVALGIYTLYRRPETWVNVLVSGLAPGDAWAALRLTLRDQLPLPGLVRDSLPGGLWVLAATLLSHGVFLVRGHLRMNLATLPVLAALGMEVLQWAAITNGTFDPMDAAMEAAGWAGALLWIHYQGPRVLPAGGWRFALCLASYAILPLADVR